MALARFQRTIVDTSGNVVASPTITVRDQSTNELVPLYSDRAGTVSISNPFTGTSGGLAAFHSVGGAYKITATSGAFSITWDWVGIGTAQELDVEDIDDLIDTAVAAAFPDPLTVNKGGTGLATLTANNVILGNGASNVQFVAPSTSGNVLTSNGTTWASTAIPAQPALSTASGSAPSYSARAWVNFNGDGVVTIRESGNVSSVSDNGVGRYTVNFTTNMPDVNFAVSLGQGSTSNAAHMPTLGNSAQSPSFTVSSFRIVSVNASGTFVDQQDIHASVFR